MMNNTSYEKVFNDSLNGLGKVAVLLGGVSAEREISLQSGQAVLASLIECGVDAFGVDIHENVIQQLGAIECDRAFIALHGVGGEDGKIQAILECMGIPYTGSDVASSALALNKIRTKLVWMGANLPTPKFEVLNKETNFSAVLAALGGRCFIKPASEGSSLGMRRVNSDEEMKSAFEYAVQFDDEIIAEQTISGREFTVSILNGKALPSIELRAKNDFYDFDAKYISDETEYVCPGNIASKAEQEIQKLALDAFNILGCSGWGRVDFMQSESGQFYLLEANTVPGMTSHSLVPMAAKVVGLSFGELLTEILVSTLDSDAQ